MQGARSKATGDSDANSDAFFIYLGASAIATFFFNNGEAFGVEKVIVLFRMDCDQSHVIILTITILIFHQHLKQLITT